MKGVGVQGFGSGVQVVGFRDRGVHSGSVLQISGNSSISIRTLDYLDLKGFKFPKIRVSPQNKNCRKLGSVLGGPYLCKLPTFERGIGICMVGLCLMPPNWTQNIYTHQYSSDTRYYSIQAP